jgi:hypothetical protein
MDPTQSPRPERDIDLEQEVLDDAFQSVPGDRMELEKKILSVAFLIEASTGEGNTKLDATAALGFAAVLRGCAEDAAALRRELRRLEQ